MRSCFRPSRIRRQVVLLEGIVFPHIEKFLIISITGEYAVSVSLCTHGVSIVQMCIRDSGKSRHGAPVRKIQNTPLIKRRLSWAIPPHCPRSVSYTHLANKPKTRPGTFCPGARQLGGKAQLFRQAAYEDVYKRQPFTVVDGGAWIAKTEGVTYRELYSRPDSGASSVVDLSLIHI